jgi:dermatan 4-sulfotransferase 1
LVRGRKVVQKNGIGQGIHAITPLTENCAGLQGSDAQPESRLRRGCQSHDLTSKRNFYFSIGTSNPVQSIDEPSLRQKRLAMQARLRGFTPFAKSNSNGTVLVFRHHNIAYMPVPKAANSSIRAALLPLIGRDPHDVQRIQQFDGFDKTTIRRFVRAEHSPDWLFFTFVRNPYSRYASAYLDKLVTRHEPLRPLVRMGLQKGDSFAHFLRTLELWPSDQINEHFAPQTKILAAPLTAKGLQIGKLENLQADWASIQAEIKSRCGIALPGLEMRNAGKSGSDWRALYDEGTIAMVRKLAAADFERFGYSTDFPR